jgi:hypothetical protein
MPIMTIKQLSFDNEPCVACEHPKGRHGPECWAYGLLEPKCRKHCKQFKRDNLKWLEAQVK